MKKANFYDKAMAAMKAEIDRLEGFTDELDRDPAKKKDSIAEYKCAKYRYAGVSAVYCAMYNCREASKRHNLQSTFYLLLPFYEMIKDSTDFYAEYENADDTQKPDIALYYSMNAFADRLIAEKEPLIPMSTDWEKIELIEYIGGYRFAKACLADAWED